MSKMNGENAEQFQMKISVIGAGSFGTALAEIAARAGNQVKLYARNTEVANYINEHHKNPHYLSEFDLSHNIVGVNNVEEALTDVDFVILAIPTQLVRALHFW